MFRDDLVSELRVACVLDPAIDRAATEIHQYAESRDPEMVHALTGQAIHWFRLRPISAGMFTSFVEQAPTWQSQATRAFQASVACIENFTESGAPWRSCSPPTLDTGTGKHVSLIDERELEHVRRRFGLPWIYEIGKVAYQRAAEGNTLGGGVSYTLPPTSHAGLIQIAHQLAEQSRKAAETATSAPHPSSSMPTPDAP